MQNEPHNPPQPPQRQYQFEDFLLDLGALTLRRDGGAPVPLRPKSFATLVYLIENRSRVVPKHELLEQIWSGLSVSDDVLVGCIREVRHALGASKRVIRTVPKTGYQFVSLVVEGGAGAALPPPSLPRSRARWLVLGLATAALLGVLLVWRFWPRPTVEVGWWRFDGPPAAVARDSSGYRNDGRVSGRLVQIRDAPFGRGLEFAGAGFIAGTTPGTGFPRKNDSFTVAVWLRARAPIPDAGPIFHFGTANDAPRSNAHLFLSATGAVCMGWGYGFEASCGSKPVTDGKWHFVAATYSGADHRFLVYVDGFEHARFLAQAPADLGHGSPWTIGSFQTGGNPFVGSIADVRLFDGRLSHPQIAALGGCAVPDAVQLPGGGGGYLVPLYRATVERYPAPSRSDGGFEYSGFGKGGVEFGVPDGNCSLASLQGASLPPDLRIAADLFLPAGTAGGPFFRAHRVRPGDPIEAAGNGGCWLRLSAAGAITVDALSHDEASSAAALATASSPGPVHPGEWHRLEAEVHGPWLRAWLDGKAVVFRSQSGTEETLSLAGLPAETGAGIAVQAPPQPTDAVLLRSITVTAPSPAAARVLR